MQDLSTLDVLDQSNASIPVAIRDAWSEYVARTVRDMWQRPVLSPRDRSMVTVAAVAALRCPAELRTQVELARAHGISQQELCELMLQVGGYAGLAIAREGLIALADVFAHETAESPNDDDHGYGPLEIRHQRAREVVTHRNPTQVDLIFGATNEYPKRADDGTPVPFTAEGPDWLGWVTDTSFGDLWTRPGLTALDRERATIAVLMALGRTDELRSHIRSVPRFGISDEELGEQIMHLAIYLGFPAAVEAMMLTKSVAAEAVTAAGEDPS